MTLEKAKLIWRNCSHKYAKWGVKTSNAVQDRYPLSYMNEITVTKDQHDALKTLADTNMKISEAKNALFKLQETETAYLTAREEKAMGRINKMFEDSKDILTQTQKNYNETQQFHNTVSSFAESLVEAHKKFQALLADFDSRNDVWEKEVSHHEKQVTEIKHRIEEDKAKNANEKKNLELAKKSLEIEKKRLEDERGTLTRVIERLKNNRI